MFNVVKHVFINFFLSPSRLPLLLPLCFVFRRNNAIILFAFSVIILLPSIPFQLFHKTEVLFILICLFYKIFSLVAEGFEWSRSLFQHTLQLNFSSIRASHWTFASSSLKHELLQTQTQQSQLRHSQTRPNRNQRNLPSNGLQARVACGIRGEHRSVRRPSAILELVATKFEHQVDAAVHAQSSLGCGSHKYFSSLINFTCENYSYQLWLYTIILTLFKITAFHIFPHFPLKYQG